MNQRLSMALAAFCLVAAMPFAGTARAEGDMSALAWFDEPQPAPDVTFTVEGGDTRTLEDYRGKVIVLNFWAVWCPPCREEMPSLDRLQAAYGGDRLVVMAMSQDRGGEDDIREFYNKIEATSLGVFSDPAQHVSRNFQVLGLPTTFIIDHNGNEVAKLVGSAEWDADDALRELQPLIEAAARDNDANGSDQASLAVNP